MAPTHTKSTTRYFSLACVLLAATSSKVLAGSSYDDDSYSVPITNEGNGFSSAYNNNMGVAVDPAVNNADHATSDFMVPSTLEQVHVITRHGARTSLSKEADSLAEAGGATLTPLGQQQLHDLGDWLRNEYLDVLGSSITGEGRSLGYYNPNLHLIESSNLDRTLTSANALAKGLFPGTKRASGAHSTPVTDPEYETKELFDSPFEVPIPVYTTGLDHNDVTLRAYKNCPTFQDRLKKLYRSDKWRALEDSNEELLTKLGQWFPLQAVHGKVPLKDAWNIYDSIHVARTECFDDASNAACAAFIDVDTIQKAAQALSTTDFERLETLVEHAEFLKFGAGIDTDPDEGMVTAGHLLGSNLLWKILNRAKGDGDFFVYSAHFPTLLGLLSTMQASTDFWRDTGGEKFFDYGSALIVEIHKSRDKEVHYFVLKYKSTESDTAVNIVIHESETGVKCGRDEDSGMAMIEKASWCLLEEVKTWAEIYTLRTEQDWCKACGNKEADVCLAPKGSSSRLDIWASTSPAMGYTSAPGATAIICLLFFGGFCAGALMMGLVWTCSRGCGSKSKGERSGIMKQKPANMMYDDSTSSVSGGSNGPSEPVVSITMEDAFPSSEMSAEDMRGKEIC